MQRIFFDANILIDWLNKDSSENKLCSDCIEKSLETASTIYVSPTSLAIVYYFVSKRNKGNKYIKDQLKDCFQLFNFTTEDANIVKQSFESGFVDLEDAIQYFSALDSKADVIVTFNVKDFKEKKIPVLNPYHFLSLFY